jgi:hypothetical protein
VSRCTCRTLRWRPAATWRFLNCPVTRALMSPGRTTSLRDIVRVSHVFMGRHFHVAVRGDIFMSQQQLPRQRLDRWLDADLGSKEVGAAGLGRRGPDVRLRPPASRRMRSSKSCVSAPPDAGRLMVRHHGHLPRGSKSSDFKAQGFSHHPTHLVGDSNPCQRERPDTGRPPDWSPSGFLAKLTEEALAVGRTSEAVRLQAIPTRPAVPTAPPPGR